MTGALRILSAGAGAGKTYSLSEAIVSTIEAGVPADHIMATTFTIKAADELTERVRRKLLEKGVSESAVTILDGYVGTMNSVFGRLLREFALELGLSPEQKVLPEGESTILFKAVAAEVIGDYYKRNAAVFRRLQMDAWEETVEKIIKMARENGMTPAAVRRCADSVWTRLKDHVLPEPLDNGEALNSALRHALQFVCSRGPAEGDTTKATAQAVEKLKSILSKWVREGEINWQEWAQISKMSPGKKSREDFEPLTAAAVHDRHPQLHQDMKDAIYVLFLCAAEAMDTYQAEKAKRGMVDFTDQEALALELLMRKDLEEALQDRISHVFIDEFQDCSPLQLALISRLRQLADRSTWVGDVKQAIFGFRGTDPVLMTAAMEHVDDKFIEILGESRRSRKSLVQFVNGVFVPVLKPMGLSADKVQLNWIRPDKEQQSVALETWLYPESKNQENDTEALANGIQELLANRSLYLVEDKRGQQLRPIRPSDVAVLCRANNECRGIADALGRRGIRATVGGSGLLSTPEAVMAVAVFSYIADAKDTLALAEILHYVSATWSDGGWLEPWLKAENPQQYFRAESRVAALDSARERVADMSPTEVLDLALSAANIYELVLAWGDGDQRLANVDAVRALARQYEDSCAVNGIAATIGGLALFFEEVSTSTSDLNRVAESRDDDAVNILTYHRSKGLEWPLVILTSLHNSSERNGPPQVFNQTIATTESGHEFDFEQPLAGRRLFYWPWPYGQQSTQVGLDGYVDGLDELTAQKRRAREENIRLMYVGMTRARDYLIFATRDPDKAHWLKELRDENGGTVLSLPSSVATDDPADATPGIGTAGGSQDEESFIVVAGTQHSCKLRILPLTVDDSEVGRSTSLESLSETAYVAAVDASLQTSFVPAHFQPSKVGEEMHGAKTLTADLPATVVEIGGRMPISGDVDMASLGDMVHAFLAADNIGRPNGERVALAEDLQRRFKIHVITADAMVQAANSLAKFIGDRYSDVVAMHREWPIHVRRGLQKASGWIDLAVETPEGWVLIDHKSFPGPTAKWIDKAKGYLPQLQIYAHALQTATNKPVLHAWIHMPIVGAMVGFGTSALDVSDFVG